jgi:hypothetical protein
MAQLMSHTWLAGSAGPVPPHPIVRNCDIDITVLEQVVALGIPEQMVVDSVKGGKRDQISTTYYLVEKQMGRSRRGSEELEDSNGDLGSSPIDASSPTANRHSGSRLEGCYVM